MRKKLISLFMVVVLIVAMSLVGCSGDKTEDVDQNNTNNDKEDANEDKSEDANEDTSEDQSKTEELTTITVPSYRTGEDVGAKFFLPQIERFNQKYEGKYKIVIEESPSNTHTDRIKQLALQDELPAMFQVSDATWVDDYLVANDKLQDLSQFINDRPEMAKYFIKDSLDFCTKSGKIIALPVTFLKPTGLYYNSALFKPSKPLTEMSWDEFATELGTNKIAYQTAEGGWTISLILTGIIGSLEGGPELLKDGIVNNIKDFNNPILVEAFTILQNSFKSNGWDGAIGATYPDAANSFYANQTAVLPDGTWIIEKVHDNTDWANGFDGANVVGDYYPGNVAIANPCVYDWLVPAGLPQNELDLVYAFFEFMYTPEEIEAFLLAEGGSSPNLTYSDSFQAELDKNTLLKDFATKTNGETTYAPYFSSAIGQALFVGDFTNLMTYLYNGEYTPEQFCEELTKAAQLLE